MFDGYSLTRYSIPSAAKALGTEFADAKRMTHDDSSYCQFCQDVLYSKYFSPDGYPTFEDQTLVRLPCCDLYVHFECLRWLIWQVLAFGEITHPMIKNGNQVRCPGCDQSI